MNQLEVFKSNEFGSIRVTNIGGEPWFVAADVCKALEIGNPSAALNRLETDERMTLNSNEGHYGQRGGAQQLSVVNEPGLYSLILGSRKPEAKAFKRWITHEVIPSIRKNGAYITEEKLWEIATSPEALHKLTGDLIAERKQNLQLREENEMLLGKAQFYDCFVDAAACTNIRETAKELEVPERKLARYLIAEKLAYRAPAGHLLPYAKPENKGLFVVRDFCKNGHFGSYTLITPKGKLLLQGVRQRITEGI